MEVFVIIVIVVALLAVFGGMNRNSGDRRAAAGSARRPAPQPARPYVTGVLPERLGLAPDVPLTDMAGRLERAFAAHYGSTLKSRVLAKYPRMTEAEYDWKLVELKRYLLMNAVLKGVPMFSPEVDDIWHEMLLFTREYESFCEQWYGRVIHHAPHGESVPMPGERAWFDWVYAQLFVPTEYSGQIWRGFFRYPLEEELLRTLETQTPEQLMETRFNRWSAEAHPEAKRTIELVIGKAKEQIAQSRASSAEGRLPSAARPVLPSPSRSGAPSHYASGGFDYGSLAAAMMLFSVVDPSGYGRQMEEVLPEEEKQNWANCGSAACTAPDDHASGTDGGGDGDWGTGDSGSDSGGGSDGGGSSCSSSSCSSGCGGGD